MSALKDWKPVMGLLLFTSLWSGCGGAEKTPESPREQTSDQYEPADGELPEIPYDFAAPPEPTLGTARLDEKWWESESPCPEGSQKVGGPPPEHLEVGCKTDKNKNVGRATRFFKNGTKQEEGTFADHFAEDTWTVWNEDGQKISETQYQHGKKNGLESIWYPGGAIKSQRPYVDGKRHGVVFIWDEKERKRTAVPYEKGVQHGFEARWDQDGQLVRVIEWERGSERK
jgi:hypothetical protein